MQNIHDKRMFALCSWNSLHSWNSSTLPCDYMFSFSYGDFDVSGM
jgi:hypothetical protein